MKVTIYAASFSSVPASEAARWEEQFVKFGLSGRLFSYYFVTGPGRKSDRESFNYYRRLKNEEAKESGATKRTE